MSTIARRFTVAIALLVCAGCGSPMAPSTVVGDWTGRVAPLHFAWLSIRFVQQGRTISGIACYQDPEGAADKKGILFRDVPVTINYPQVMVQTETGSFRFWFSGRFDSDATTIIGSSG